MEAKYLFHSGVSVSFNKTLLVFDYYKKGMGSSDIESYDRIFVFVSHGHRDHFDRDIFSWRKSGKEIIYIVSYDTELEPGKDIHLMEPDQELKFGSIVIRTLDSTDEGVAFLVETPEGNVFHAGDLNWWHWEGEPGEDNRAMGEKFKGEIEKLSGIVLDMAFIPVDKRLGGAQYLSIDYLMKYTEVRKVFPIHFWDDWEYMDQVRKDLTDRKYYKRIDFYGR